MHYDRLERVGGLPNKSPRDVKIHSDRGETTTTPLQWTVDGPIPKAKPPSGSKWKWWTPNGQIIIGPDGMRSETPLETFQRFDSATLGSSFVKQKFPSLLIVLFVCPSRWVLLQIKLTYILPLLMAGLNDWNLHLPRIHPITTTWCILFRMMSDVGSLF